MTEDAPSPDHRVIIGRDAAIAAPEVSVQDQAAHARTRVGRTLNDRWCLDSLLGVGGMASVYAATHRNGNRVAIKILHPELSAYEDLKERFLEEGYAANNVAHPGVVAVHDDGISEEGGTYLVMELLDGETLQARWQRMSLAFSPRDVLFIADQILEVLEAAHSNGIVHRDIKPENIFLTRDGRLKLLDFGIAHNEHSRRTQRTQAGSAMGTPAFMPPEQALGHTDRIDGRTDLWALGATLFWLVSGRFVRTGSTTNEELLQAMTLPPPPVRTVAPHASAPLARVIDTALAFEKHDRFPNAGAMRVAVSEALAALESEPDPQCVPHDMSLEQAAVLLSDDEPSPSVSSSRPTTTYRPVTRSNGPAAARASEAAASSRKRLPVALALGLTLAAASAVLLVPIPDFSTALLGNALLSVPHPALAAGTRSAPAPAATQPPREEAVTASEPPVVRDRERRPAQKSAAQSPAAALASTSATMPVQSNEPVTEPQNRKFPRDPLSRRK